MLNIPSCTVDVGVEHSVVHRRHRCCRNAAISPSEEHLLDTFLPGSLRESLGITAVLEQGIMAQRGIFSKEAAFLPEGVFTSQN